MPLDRQLVPIPFAQGVDTKTDSKSVPAGKLLSLKNARFLNPKSIQKRNGSTAIVTKASTTNLATYKNELLVFGGATGLGGAGHMWSLNSAKSALVDRGNVTSAHLTHQNISQTANPVSSQDCAIGNGYAVFSWIENLCACYAVIEQSTGAKVSGATIESGLLSTDGTRCFAVGSSKFVIMWGRNEVAIRYAIYDAVAGTLGSTVSLAADVVGGIWDACWHVTSSRVCVAYQQTSQISVTLFNASMVLQATQAIDKVAIQPITIFPDNTTNVVVAWGADDGVWSAGYSSALSQLQAPTQIHTGAVAIYSIAGCGDGFGAAGTYVLFYSKIVSGNVNQIYYAGVAGWTAGFPADGEFNVSVTLAGRPFAAPRGCEGGVYLPVVHHTGAVGGCTQQDTYFLLGPYNANSTSTMRNVIARWLPGTAGLPEARLPSITKGTTAATYATIYMATQHKTVLSDIGQNAAPGTISVFEPTGVGLTSINFDSNVYSRNAYYSKELGNNLHVSGGMLWMYDGANAVEHGFLLYPEGVTVSNPVTDFAAAAHSYGYQVVYEWVDKCGQVHYSAPSPIVIQGQADEIGSAHTVTVAVPALWMTRKTGVLGVIYRTLDGGSAGGGGGTVYHRVGTVSVDAAAAKVSSNFTDNVTDAVLQYQPMLYTTGGVLENIAPPPCTSLTVFANRMWLLDSTNQNVVWFSKRVEQDLPVEFSDALTLNIPSEGGNTVAMGVLDEKLVFFKQSSKTTTGARVYYITGIGPDSTGNNSDFGDPHPVQIEVGCTDPRSVGAGPSGLVFRANDICMLDRGMNLQRIGYDIQGLLDAEPLANVASVVLVEDQRQLRILTSGAAAQTLVYDYAVGAWSQYTYTNAVSDAVMWNGVYVYLDNQGNIRQESSTLYSDAGTWVTMSAETSWLQLAGIQGFQRIRRVLLGGKWLGPCTVSASVYVDFVESVVQTSTLTALTNPTPWQWRIDLGSPTANVQKCQAMKLYFTDAQISLQSVEGGVGLSALTFEAGVKRGTAKLPTTKIAG